MEFNIYLNVNGYKNLYRFKKMFYLITNETLFYLSKKGNYEISVTFCSDNDIKNYNKKFRNIDKSTDVLSFAFNDYSDKINDEDIPNDLGDIIISIDTARRQANEFSHSLKREICFLYLHGLLHLLGYDHTKSLKDEKIMFDLQDEILNKVNIRS
ncbi:MAG: rRNA maturation RNase YbeY [Bacilli bacterium]|nr:rRNA maturation RNase YbeY [Bacilli bacterium]